MPTVLIADDSRVYVHQVSGWLQDKGAETIAAFDALQAWIFALRVRPDAIILDVSLPAGSGLEVLKRLKASTKTHHIPVIVISGSGGPETRDLVKRLGGEEFLQKPLD